MNVSTLTPAPRPKAGFRILWTVAGVMLVGGIAFRIFCGFYTIQPIGALPEGRTLVVWRAAQEPFFNSPDAMCLDRMGGVSLMCRMIAMGQAPTDRIVVRLPYIKSAYFASTGGRTFEFPAYP
jgi:hypothetical protein